MRAAAGSPAKENIGEGADAFSRFIKAERNFHEGVRLQDAALYFDFRLWQLTSGLQRRIAVTAVMGLLASVVGVARFAVLGSLIALVYRGAPAAALILPAAAAIVFGARLPRTRAHHDGAPRRRARAGGAAA